MLGPLHKRRLAYLAAVSIVLAGLVAILQWMINRMDEHEPFRRVGLSSPTASLPETLDWLKAAIQGAEVTYMTQFLAGARSEVAERQEEVSYKDCTLIVKISDLTFDTSGYRISIDLSELDQVGRPIKMVYGDATFWKVPLQAIGSRDVIQERSGFTNYTSLTISTPELAQRVVNAFNHAIRLCQKNKGRVAQVPKPEKPPQAKQEGQPPDEEIVK